MICTACNGSGLFNNDTLCLNCKGEGKTCEPKSKVKDIIRKTVKRVKSTIAKKKK